MTTAIHLSAKAEDFFEALKFCPTSITRHILVGSMNHSGRSYSLPGHTRSHEGCWKDLDKMIEADADQPSLRQLRLDVIYVSSLNEIIEMDEKAAYIIDLAGFWYLENDTNAFEWFKSCIHRCCDSKTILIAGMITYFNNWITLLSSSPNGNRLQTHQRGGRLQIYERELGDAFLG